MMKHFFVYTFAVLTTVTGCWKTQHRDEGETDERPSDTLSDGELSSDSDDTGADADTDTGSDTNLKARVPTVSLINT